MPRHRAPLLVTLDRQAIPSLPVSKPDKFVILAKMRGLTADGALRHSHSRQFPPSGSDNNDADRCFVVRTTGDFVNGGSSAASGHGLQRPRASAVSPGVHPESTVDNGSILFNYVERSVLLSLLPELIVLT